MKPWASWHHCGRKHLTAKKQLLNESDGINHSLNMTIDHTRLQKADSHVTIPDQWHMNMSGIDDKPLEE